MSEPITTVETFWARVERTDGCWLWTGSLDRKGYGQFMPHRGVNLRAHRVAWDAENGPVPAGLVLDHLCRNRACVNPAHMEPVPNRENVLRGVGPSAVNARKTHCPQGHPYSRENTRLSGSERICRICDRAKWERSNAKRKAQRNGAAA